MTTTQIYYSPQLDIIMTIEVVSWVIDYMNAGEMWFYIGDL